MQYFRPIVNNKILKLCIILLILVGTIYYWNEISSASSSKFHVEENMELAELYIKKHLIPDKRNLFFIETSCAINNTVTPSGMKINRRQACSIYSTAVLNPSRQIILYHSCPLHNDFYERSTEFNKYLLDLPNFFIFHAKLEDLMKGTCVGHVFEDLQRSNFPVEHAADITRLLMVYKYGGAYLDLDFVSIKPFVDLPKNFIVAEANSSLSNGVFQFEAQGKGHEFVKEMLIDLAYNYNGIVWAANGPQLFMRTYRKFCNYSENVLLTPITSPCGISVTSSKLFFPVHFSNWKWFFYPYKSETVVELLIKDSVAVHFWNFLSKNEIVKIGEHCAYETIAAKHCKNILMNTSTF
uniref:Putative lactosylceramide 4-alpha-galactosyltransferase n=1 Tax=Rhodnius prolixus TaxID=13249 RepID=R4FJ90_RHOPR